MIQKRDPAFFYIKGDAQIIMHKGQYTLKYADDAYYVVNEDDEVVVFFQLKAEDIDGMQFPKMEFVTTNEKFKNQGLGLLAYEFTFGLYKGLWSDTVQSPGGQKLWVKLAERYNVFAYNTKTKKFTEVVEENGILKSTDPDTKIYGPNGNRMIVFRAVPEAVKAKLK